MPTPPGFISPVTYNSYFGNVTKCVWFETSNNYNYFEIEFSIQLQKYKTTNLSLYSNYSKGFVWEANYPEDIDEPFFQDIVEILNIQQISGENAYAIFNNPT